MSTHISHSRFASEILVADWQLDVVAQIKTSFFNMTRSVAQQTQKLK